MIGPTLARQMQLSAFAMERNTVEMTHEESLVRAGDGNNANWVVGHLAHARNQAVRLAGQEPPWTDEASARYTRGTLCVEAENALAWDDLLTQYDRAGEILLPWLAEATDEVFATKLPEPHEILGETIGSAMTALVFHEAYHVGQLGVLRRVVGKAGGIA